MSEQLADQLSEHLSEGLRERKKRLMRELLSDTATELFLAHGFGAVTVADVAAACGVSEKTVYNYFPTKEDLLLDREEAMTQALRAALGPQGSDAPVAAVLGVLDADLGEIAAWADDADDVAEALGRIRAMAELVESTPSLRAHQRDMMDRLVQAAAEALAERTRLSPDDPEPQIAADALVGLYRVQFRALVRHAGSGLDGAGVRRAVSDEVRRAARLVESGLWSLSAVLPGAAPGADAAADAVLAARRQVVAALREARGAFESLREAGREHDAAHKRGREQADSSRPARRQPSAQARREAKQRWRGELSDAIRREALEQAAERIEARGRSAQGRSRERERGR